MSDKMASNLRYRSPIRLFAMGAGAFGVMLGAWIALSSSPVVTTALPLLFAIVGAATGTMVAKLDLTKESNREKLNILGAGLASFCSLCTVAMVVGLLARPSLADYFERHKPQLDITSHTSPLDALLLRVRLHALGATVPEMRSILAKPFPNDFNAIDDVLRIIANRPAENRPAFIVSEPRARL